MNESWQPENGRRSRRGLWIGLGILLLLLAVAGYGVISVRQAEDAHWVVGQVGIDVGGWETAVVEFDQLLSIEPAFLRQHTARATALRGVAHYQLGDLEAALNDFDAALAIDPNMVDIIAYRADLLYQEGEFESALADTELALDEADLLPAHLQALLYVDRAHMLAEEDAEAALEESASARSISEHLPDTTLGSLYLLEAELLEGQNNVILTKLQDALSVPGGLSPDQLADVYGMQASLLFEQNEWPAAYVATDNALTLAEELSDQQVAWLHRIRAEILFERGELETAVDEANLATSYDQSLAFPHALRGWNAYLTFDEETALTAAEIALDLDERTALAYRTRGAVYTWQGKIEAALDELNEALNLNPEDVEALALRTFNRLHLNDKTAAVADAQQAMRINENTAATWWAQALIAGFEGDFEYANALINRAIALDDSRPEYFLIRAASYRLTLDDERMFADLEHALALNPDFVPAMVDLAMERANQFEFDGFEETALQVLERWPEWDIGYTLMGRYHVDVVGDLEEALTYMDRAIEVRPDSPDNYVNRGFVYELNGEYDLAQADFEKALALAPGNPRAWHGLGLIQQQLEDLESARASMEQMVALSPKSLGLRVNIAWFYLDIGETEQAWELVHEVLADDPDYSDALFLRALMLNDIGEDRRALADIERILNRVPNHLPAHWLRAQSMLALGELNATRDSAESVLRIDASFYDVHRILLLAALEEEDFEAAEHQLELWQEKVPEDEMDYQLLGSMQQTLGLYEDAIATYTLGLEIVGELDAFYFNRGLSYLNLSDVEPQYEADFEKVLQLSHDLDLLSEAEYWLVSYVLTTSSTDGIVTVVDEELGYTINYSEAWSQVPLAPNSGTDLSLEWIFDEGYATIEIRHFVEADDLTVDDAVELVNAEVNNIPEFETLAIESLSIAGVDARKRIYEFTFEGDAGQPVVLAGRQYYVVNDGILWIITAEIEADFIADFEAEFDMVINSFTFLP